MIAILSQWFLSLYSEYMSHISVFLISNHYLSIQTNLNVVHPRLEGKDQRIAQACFVLFPVKLF